MKRIIIFGFGEMGKKLINECLNYNINVAITAIADNHAKEDSCKNIPVIRPDALMKYTYDEIWICTVYFEEVMNQLYNDYGIEKGKMHFVEPVVPILERRLREKYSAQINNLDSVSGELKSVLTYLKDNPLRMYCYSFFDEYLYKKSEIQYDATKGLYYGVYEEKRMYLARRFDTESKARAYYNAVTMEQDFRSPHCYWNNEELNKVSGVGVDIGAAEGIFALKVIEQVEHMYLIEMDEQWVEALQYTFEPYQNKVTIIQKFVANEDSENHAKLDILLHSKKIDFIKMDIEGMELEALKGAESLLRDNRVQLAVCVYHHKMDNEVISKWLKEIGYNSQNSEGLVVCQGDWELEKDETDFRKALLFANNY